MKRRLDQMNFDVMYSKAKAAFEKCITTDGNRFLNEEIDIPVSEIITKNELIRIKFFGNNKNHYIVEARLLLFSQSDEKIGYYCYHEDENEEVVDDYLVFE